ncbi:hypothetical protein B0H19DRAFT_1272984 [Mycena capillaripes]|nr:hypothetical protein B0H19DRAFT_1272984 [Mycena capillaripes]
MAVYSPLETWMYPQLPSILFSIREAVLSSFPRLQKTTSVPKICLVGSLEHCGAGTIDGRYLCTCQANLSVRALNDPGQWEDSLPELVLLALSVAQGVQGSVPYKIWIVAQAKGCGGGRQDQVREFLGVEIVDLSTAHPSGVLEAQATFSDTDNGRRAVSVRSKKTLFELMRGEFVPPKVTLTHI